MNDASRPVAVRVIRPYASEDEYVAKEGDSITKTTIELIGAHSRPTGVVLRFEVTLQSGKTLIRGEGRVTAFNERGRDGSPSLSLRFTKMDAKSKALVDRIVALRTPGAAVPPPAPSSQDLHPLSPPSQPASQPAAQTVNHAPEQPAPQPDSAPDVSSAKDTAPPPTPLAPMASRAELVARSAEIDDPDPEGEAVTNPPPNVVTSAPPAPSDTRSPGSLPPPTTRPSVLPPAVRAELRRMSEQPPPLPSALPAYDSSDHDAERDRIPESEVPAHVVTSARSPSAAPPAPVPAMHAATNGGSHGGPKRDALLERLRERARALAPDRVAEIVKPRPRGTA